MKNIYTCGCLADDFRNKTIHEILKIFETQLEYSSFIRINHDDDFIFFVHGSLNFVIRLIVGIFSIKHVVICLE